MSTSSTSGGYASKDISLLEHLDLSQVNCLNETSDHSIKSILSSRSRNVSDAFLTSDADEQLLLNIFFNQKARIKSVIIQTKNAAQGPKLVLLFTNKASLGFDDVDTDPPSEAPVQVLDLTEDQVTEGKHIYLSFVKFQHVNSLHMFVVANQRGEDETRIDALDIFGTLTETTRDLSALNNQEESM